MEYTILLTSQPNTMWRATVPGLPDCVVEASSRTEVLEKIKHCISDVVSHTEVLSIELPDVPKTSEARITVSQTPWPWFGIFQDDHSWGTLFEDIEAERDANLTES